MKNPFIQFGNYISLKIYAITTIYKGVKSGETWKNVQNVCQNMSNKLKEKN